MQNESFEFANNKAIRGYIMRSLAKGHNNTLLCRQLVHVMVTDSIIVSPDITKYLDYLNEREYIAFTNEQITSYTAYANDAVIKLTAKGVDLIECTRKDPGVDI